MKRGLGELETLLLAYVQMRGQGTIRAGELTGPLGLGPVQERKLLSRMAQAGLITRVWRGLYLVPPRLPMGGKWSPGEALAINALMQAHGGRYQICGPNAFNRYGFDEQIPTRIYAYNNRLSGSRTIGAVALTLFKVPDERLGATEEVWSPPSPSSPSSAPSSASALSSPAAVRLRPSSSPLLTSLPAIYSSRVRTLVDAVHDWSRFGSLPRAYEWIRQELAKERVKPAELAAVAVHYGNQGTIRRIGALLELEGVSPGVLRKLHRALQSARSTIPWVPARPNRGHVNRRWGVVLNG